MLSSPDRHDPRAVLVLDGLKRIFHQGEREIRVLDGASATLYAGEAVALVGPSGAGKSTLLHIAGLLETPDEGRVAVSGRDCAKMSDDERTRVRRAEMGFVYQFHQLLPEFSAVENAAMPLMIQGLARKVAQARAKELLEGLGLGHRLDHRPPELSGGEQQRTAIARALAIRPKLLLADEPTGNLDPSTSEHVFQDLVALIEKTGVAALIATHNMDLARRMHRVLRLADGRLAEVDRATLA
ncbi:MAG: ABC transporter ATP-binding protein [Hyphomicrobiaceae bacterium]